VADIGHRLHRPLNITVPELDFASVAVAFLADIPTAGEPRDQS